MRKLVQFFYNNKTTIIAVIGIMIFVVILVQIMDKSIKIQEQKQYEENKKNIIDSSNTTIDNSDYLINQGKKVKKSTNNSIKDTLDSFVNYCNNKQIEEAYSMLTDDCKEELFPTLEKFKTSYCDLNFDTKKTYTMQAWDKDDSRLVYRIILMQDILETGMADEQNEDYYTFVGQNDGSYKLNIANFIYKEKFSNTETNKDNIDVKVTSKVVYKDYVIYEFQIFNNTDGSIFLNDSSSNKRIYLTNDNDVKYSSMQSEFDKSDKIIIKPSNNRKFKVKFNKGYNTNVVEEKLVINKIILNYDESQDAQNNDNIAEFSVDLK